MSNIKDMVEMEQDIRDAMTQLRMIYADHVCKWTDLMDRNLLAAASVDQRMQGVELAIAALEAIYLGSDYES